MFLYVGSASQHAKTIVNICCGKRHVAERCDRRAKVELRRSEIAEKGDRVVDKTLVARNIPAVSDQLYCDRAGAS